jgi:hypothetical protein
MAGGRPTKYTKLLANEICRRIASGRTTLSVSKDEDMPNRSTIIDWTYQHEEFSIMYDAARKKLYDHWADEIVDEACDESRDYQKRKRTKISNDGKKTIKEIIEETVSDNTATGRDRLKVDSKKWLLSRLLPKQYGDKIEQQITGKDGAEFQPVLNITIEKKG